MRLSRALLPTSDTDVQADVSTQERILDKAAELFWKKGYAATTTREIAASLGIRQASLYHHVASKENLLCQLCVTSLEGLLQEVKSAVNESNSPGERIRLLVHAHLNTLLKYRTRHALMLKELRALSGACRRQVLALRKRYEKLVLSILNDGQSVGAVRTDIPTKYLCLALLNILNWAVLWFRDDDAFSADQLAGIFARTYIGGATTSAGRLAVSRLQPGARNVAVRRRKPAKTSQRASSTLLDAAAALFAKKGYDLTSTREIAAQLGINKASLYYHIQTKEDLLFDICNSALRQIRDDVEAALKDASNPLQRTEILIRTHIESMLREYERHSAALTEMSCLSTERLAEVTALRDAYEGLTRSVLDEAQTAGALRKDVPVKYLCLALLGLLNRVLVWFRPNGPLSPAQIGALFATIYLTGAAADPSSWKPSAAPSASGSFERAFSAPAPPAKVDRGTTKRRRKLR
jgi:TetR/AcrR family transcriptional regulator, cholesterol catabolism regulator